MSRLDNVLIETEYRSCPVCASVIGKWRVKQNRFGSYRIDLCHSCGYAFVNPRPSLGYLMEFYSTLGYGSDAVNAEIPTKESVLAREREDPDSTIDARRLACTLSELLQSDASSPRRLLDVGSGYGFFTTAALEKGFDVTSLDLATNKRKVAREITGLEPIASSFEDFACAPSTFSAVLMSQILEHVSDINYWMSKAHKILASGGILAIALPNFRNPLRWALKERSPYIIPPEHLNFFSRSSLSALLQKHGFEVERVQWVSRVPKRILRKRIPKATDTMFPLIDLVTRATFRTFDALHMGMMINVYGRKM